GTGLKPHDLQAAWACSACHDAVDARRSTEFSRDQLRTMHMEGMVRTIDILVSEGKVAA
ncbi:MAG: nuclease domain-containing protein, partial [Pseudomonas graminis]